MVISLILTAFALSITASIASVVLYETQRHRAAVVAETTAAVFGFLGGCLLPVLVITTEP